MPVPEIQGVPISIVFELARREARRVRIDELRKATASAASVQREEHEGRARRESLDRMREISSTQMTSQLSGGNMPPGLMVPRDSASAGSNMSPYAPRFAPISPWLGR